MHPLGVFHSLRSGKKQWFGEIPWILWQKVLSRKGHHLMKLGATKEFMLWSLLAHWDNLSKQSYTSDIHLWVFVNSTRITLSCISAAPIQKEKQFFILIFLLSLSLLLIWIFILLDCHCLCIRCSHWHLWFVVLMYAKATASSWLICVYSSKSHPPAPRGQPCGVCQKDTGQYLNTGNASYLLFSTKSWDIHYLIVMPVHVLFYCVYLSIGLLTVRIHPISSFWVGHRSMIMKSIWQLCLSHQANWTMHTTHTSLPYRSMYIIHTTHPHWCFLTPLFQRN